MLVQIKSLYLIFHCEMQIMLAIPAFLKLVIQVHRGPDVVFTEASKRYPVD